jgi:hypothetical protein
MAAHSFKNQSGNGFLCKGEPLPLICTHQKIPFLIAIQQLQLLLFDESWFSGAKLPGRSGNFSLLLSFHTRAKLLPDQHHS